jgi:DNA ligase D-like protein (predicted polymerase)
MAEPREVLQLDGHELSISNPDKVFFPDIGLTKMDLVRYYLDVWEGALRGCRDRPTVLKRFPNGATGEFFFQKRVPEKRPPWLETVVVDFPSGRSAEELAPQDRAHLIWAVNLGCIDLNPWPVRRADVDHPDELRIDLDPTPEASFADVRMVAMSVKEVLEAHGLRGFPKTSGSRGIHVYVRVRPEWSFIQVRRAALALAREVERHIPQLATTAWWKEERHGVFIDYNQNARDRTIASAYSVRPTADARVSTPLEWSEVPDVEPADLTMGTVPRLVADRGDPDDEIDKAHGSLESLLELSERDEKGGLGDAPWPPHFPKQEGEPMRVQPSRARRWDPGEGPRPRGGSSTQWNRANRGPAGMAAARDAITVRQLRKSQLKGLIDALDTDKPSRHQERIDLQTRKLAQYLVAWVDGRPKGHVLVRWPDLAVEGPTLPGVPSLEDLYVVGDYRRRGVGTALLSAAERAARERGLGGLWFAVGVENFEARAFYEHLGYRNGGAAEFTMRWSTVDSEGLDQSGEETCNLYLKWWAGEAPPEISGSALPARRATRRRR